LNLVNALHIAASIFINDVESGLHHDYEVWLEELAPHAPTGHCQLTGQLHNRTGEDACPERRDRNADVHLKRHGPPSEAVVVAVTNGRLDGSTELAEVFGIWEQIFSGQAVWLARESRRPAAEAGAGQNHRGVMAAVVCCDRGRVAWLSAHRSSEPVRIVLEPNCIAYLVEQLLW
jgi:thiamine phosphate synthase YjbQ (UPF0047 family)